MNVWIAGGLFVVLVLLWRNHRARRKVDFPLISSLPLLGAALEFKERTIAFLCSLSARGPVVVINLAGLYLTLLTDSELVKAFYLTKDTYLSSFRALQRLGFEDALGPLNLYQGARMHARGLRNDNVLLGFSDLLRRQIGSMLVRYSKQEVDIYKCCREITITCMVEHFVGRTIPPEFVEEYLDFQRTLENSIATSMVVGRMIAWPFLYRARRKRENLVRKIEHSVDSGHAKMLTSLDESLSKAEIADLLIGLLTAATKNVAIASASCIVYRLQNGFSGSVRNSVLETLRLTALSIGALRQVMTDDNPWGTRGSLVVVSHLVDSRDPSKWGDDALLFKPNRFDTRREDDLITFGAGVHACPGRKLAIEAMCTIVEHLAPAVESLVDAKISRLEFNRPSLADRDFAFVVFR